MRKWQSWKDDYMKADEIYLVHAIDLSMTINTS